MSSYAQRVRVYGTGYDRRVKLTEDDKEYIRWLRDEEGLSYNKLAAKFGVSKRLIMFVCCPEKYAVAQAQRKARWKDGRYVTSPEERAEIAKEHLEYKRSLLDKGLVSLDSVKVKHNRN